MKSNKISVIMPTYNRAWCIEKAIKSVLNQTYKNWELIIMDDGSTDNTKKILKAYLEDKRIKYYFQKNRGVGKARNEGVKKSSGKFVTFLDSDDELTISALEQMNQDIPLFKKYKVRIIFYKSKKNRKKNCTDKSMKDLNSISYVEAIKGELPKVETLQLIEKKVFNQNKFPELAGGMEIIFWLNLLKNESDILVRDKILRIYNTKHNDRLTGNKQIIRRSKTLPSLFNLFLRNFKADYKRHNPKQLSYFYLEKGIFEIIAKKHKKGRISLLEAKKYNYKKAYIIYIIYILSYLPNIIFVNLAKFGHKFKSILK